MVVLKNVVYAAWTMDTVYVKLANKSEIKMASVPSEQMDRVRHVFHPSGQCGCTFNGVVIHDADGIAGSFYAHPIAFSSSSKRLHIQLRLAGSDEIFNITNTFKESHDLVVAILTKALALLCGGSEGSVYKGIPTE